MAIDMDAMLAKIKDRQWALADIEEIWHALKPPYADLFVWLDGRGPRPDAAGKPVEHALEDGVLGGLEGEQRRAGEREER